MDTHPWTNYEIARLRDEERLLHAREARLAAGGPSERGPTLQSPALPTR